MMTETTSICSHEVYQRELHRQRNREYMRQWRANPENRLKEVQRREQNNAYRKQQRQEHSLRNVCVFCHARLSVTHVQRLVIKGNGFRVVNVPYCGEC